MLEHSDTETWRPVIGHEGSYEVSNQGRVRSLDRVVAITDNRYGTTYNRLFEGTLLRPGPHKSGHVTVALARAGRSRSRLVHHLVLEAFVGLRPTGAECCHANDIPNDNRLANLRWGTRSLNSFDKARNGRYKIKLNEAQIIKSRNTGRHKDAEVLAAKFGCCVSNIWSIWRGVTWQHA